MFSRKYFITFANIYVWFREIIENFAKISRKSTILKFRKAQNNFVKISCFAKFWNCCFAATLPTTSCKRVYTVHVMFKIEWIFRTQWVLVIGQLVSGHENSLFHVAKTRGGQTRTFSRLRVVASPTRKQFDDAKREDAPPLKTTRSRKTRQATYAKFRVTGISDIS